MMAERGSVRPTSFMGLLFPGWASSFGRHLRKGGEHSLPKTAPENRAGEFPPSRRVD